MRLGEWQPLLRRGEFLWRRIILRALSARRLRWSLVFHNRHTLSAKQCTRMCRGVRMWCVRGLWWSRRGELFDPTLGLAWELKSMKRKCESIRFSRSCCSESLAAMAAWVIGNRETTIALTQQSWQCCHADWRKQRRLQNALQTPWCRSGCG